MAKKYKLTRPELKRQRDALHRFERYLPMLKLKQQQLQMTLRDVNRLLREADEAVHQAQQVFQPYRAVLADLAGLDVRSLAEPATVRTATRNVAGVNIPVYEDVEFPPVTYSLFATPPWVDRALADLRELNRRLALVRVLRQQYELLHRELVKIIQRVNLFDKVKIPEARETIRIIRIKLGDEMTAAVGRAKIAKGKLTEISNESGLLEEAVEDPQS
ncbi:MAG: V-type sodium ATPase subunit D [Planctomycetes bacterium ADurb.Bin126]|nr:MAG: V-type sodium ATPase subunit D [Planctomycetes bacterium ADurb.Bin126]HOD84118.1 V-type ATP synthase subunit D [Phycisphaerae bacterium]HQL73610.1 V-type ATP synthase subunit D [Phycisphaerae bacterium]